MSDRKNPSEADQDASVDPKGSPKDAPRSEKARTYTVERLTGESDALGQPPHVIAGALASVEDDEITLEQARKEVKRYLGE